MRSTKGVRQILVLGAGLDTFAYRLERTHELRVFELDHPATQAEKRRRLGQAQIAEPAHVSYVAHDFESGSMTAALQAAGLDPDRGAFVLWLGVTPYLTEEAVFATLSELASWPGGTEVVFDYANPPDRVTDSAARAHHEQMAERVAASGEPFRCYFDSPEPARSRARSGVLRDRGPRSRGARCALSATLAGRSPARPRRACRQDGDGVTRALFPASHRRRHAPLAQPVIFGLVDRRGAGIAEIVEVHAVGLARAPRCER